MAETLISPGVLARENDSSFVSRRPVTVGAAIIGPTVKGPVEVPTIITTYNQYVNVFGTTFLSGSVNDKKTYSYFTSIAAYNYFVNGGTSLLVARVVSSSTSYLPATASIYNSLLATTASATLDITPFDTEAATVGSSSFSLNGITFTLTGSAGGTNTSNVIYVPSGSTAIDSAVSLSLAINASSSIAPYSASFQYVTASNSSANLNLFSTTGVSGLTGNTYYYISGSTTTYFAGGTNQAAFVIETLSEGDLMNSAGAEGANNILINGTENNLRFQIVNSNTANGTFDLLVRRGNDNILQPTILETWTNLSLDPNTSNYIARAIGNQVEEYDPNDNQMEYTGEFTVRSNYIRIKQVGYTTPNYFDNNGVAKTQFTASLPMNISGAFGGANGNIAGGANFYENINNTNTQGLIAEDYDNMINLLSNTDDYKFNMLITPGLVDEFGTHKDKITSIITNTQDRGDNIYIIDPVGYGSSVGAVVQQASSRNTSYAAEYWPWCQIVDPNTGNLVWVPASTLIAGVYAYNDAVSEPWFAPAGINRGGLSQVVRVEQKLSQANRDTLYNGKINPIATFPGSGIVVYGQKTLQTRASALDRVNVRRLLIALKSYISQVALNLVFEQNTIATRNQFLSQVNPYLTSVQQRQGLYAFRVIMDDSNNTPDVIDRNELIGQIYLQPTKTAEFIYLDFNITPTGATFPG
jgi:hypothetical protein